MCRRKGSSRKGYRGEAWWLTVLWDGRRLKAGWGAKRWETGTGSEAAKKWAASEKFSEKSLVVKGGGTGTKAGGLESGQNGPLAACVQELGWAPIIWGYPLCTQEITHKVSVSFLLRVCVQAGQHQPPAATLSGWGQPCNSEDYCPAAEPPWWHFCGVFKLPF